MSEAVTAFHFDIVDIYMIFLTRCRRLGIHVVSEVLQLHLVWCYSSARTVHLWGEVVSCAHRSEGTRLNLVEWKAAHDLMFPWI